MPLWTTLLQSECGLSRQGGNCTKSNRKRLTGAYSDKSPLKAIIDLPEENARGKGLATHALRLFMAYLHSLGFDELYTQTWSGNERMIKLAEKLGFAECCRKPKVRMVRGQPYDGLTFRKEF